MALSRAEASVYVLHVFLVIKGKGNSSSEAPKLRNHGKAEILKQKVYCVRNRNRIQHVSY